MCDGNEVSGKTKTRLWRTQSKTIAHEFGHLFGLHPTFSAACIFDENGVPDTPGTTSTSPNCPGLLPYNKDRDLYSRQNRRRSNMNATNDTYGGVDKVCGESCAACSNQHGQNECPVYNGLDSVSEDEVSNPICCRGRFGCEDNKSYEDGVFIPITTLCPTLQIIVLTK
jgi:Pregnancy-associated plasma protein-A